MRNIQKKREPTSLTSYRAQPNGVYNDLPSSVKQELRESLLREQGSICCYCTSRIKRETMRIEHWHCQSRYPNEQLDYQNMLAACPGNKGHPPGDQYCDARKGDSDLTLNPARHDIDNRLGYLGDGTIQSPETAFDGQINKVLNLNISRPKSNRREVVKAVQQTLSQKPGSRTRSQIKSLISRWDSAGIDGKRKEFCSVAIFFLKKRLGRA